MKIHLIIRDLGGAQPVITINGTTGGLYPFIWDAKRSAHVRSYDLSTPEGYKAFRIEQEAILNQRLQWPVLVDGTPGETVPADVETLRTELAATVTERDARASEVEELTLKLANEEKGRKQAEEGLAAAAARAKLLEDQLSGIEKAAETVLPADKRSRKR